MAFSTLTARSAQEMGKCLTLTNPSQFFRIDVSGMLNSAKCEVAAIGISIKGGGIWYTDPNHLVTDAEIIDALHLKD